MFLSPWLLLVLMHTLALAWWGIDTIPTAANDSTAASTSIGIIGDADACILFLISISLVSNVPNEVIWFALTWILYFSKVVSSTRIL